MRLLQFAKIMSKSIHSMMGYRIFSNQNQKLENIQFAHSRKKEISVLMVKTASELEYDIKCWENQLPTKRDKAYKDMESFVKNLDKIKKSL
jgi:hypothetical protein